MTVIDTATDLIHRDQTIYPSGETPHWGFLVGQREWNVRIGHNLKATGVAVQIAADWLDGVRRAFDGMEDRYHTIGSWTDTETGDVHLDVSYRYEDVRSALEVASIRGELAVWSIAGNREIPVR